MRSAGIEPDAAIAQSQLDGLSLNGMLARVFSSNKQVISTEG